MQPTSQSVSLSVGMHSQQTAQNWTWFLATGLHLLARNWNHHRTKALNLLTQSECWKCIVLCLTSGRGFGRRLKQLLSFVTLLYPDAWPNKQWTTAVCKLQHAVESEVEEKQMEKKRKASHFMLNKTAIRRHHAEAKPNNQWSKETKRWAVLRRNMNFLVD